MMNINFSSNFFDTQTQEESFSPLLRSPEPQNPSHVNIEEIDTQEEVIAINVLYSFETKRKLIDLFTQNCYQFNQHIVKKEHIQKIFSKCVNHLKVNLSEESEISILHTIAEKLFHEGFYERAYSITTLIIKKINIFLKKNTSPNFTVIKNLCMSLKDHTRYINTVALFKIGFKKNDKNQINLALKLIEKEEIEYRKEKTEETALGNKSYILSTFLFRKGQIYRKLEKEESATLCFKEALFLLENLKNSPTGKNLQVQNIQTKTIPLVKIKFNGNEIIKRPVTVSFLKQPYENPNINYLMGRISQKMLLIENAKNHYQKVLEVLDNPTIANNHLTNTNQTYTNKILKFYKKHRSEQDLNIANDDNLNTSKRKRNDKKINQISNKKSDNK